MDKFIFKVRQCRDLRDWTNISIFCRIQGDELREVVGNMALGILEQNPRYEEILIVSNVGSNKIYRRSDYFTESYSFLTTLKEKLQNDNR